MDNAYYILAEKEIDIKRLHICTWEFPNAHSYIEFGLEFQYEDIEKDSITLYLAVPFVKKEKYYVKDNSDDDKSNKGKKTVVSLLKSLSNRDNGRFIFNAAVNDINGVGEDSRDGTILKFNGREPITVLPCDITIEDGYFSFKINKPNKHEGNLYFRVLVEIGSDSIAFVKKGIAQKTYIYDLKINETRNIPQNIYDLKTNDKLEICKVSSFFCLHAIPDHFVISFVDSSKLKNIRKLETSAFQRYLPEIKDISKDCYNIIFLKDKNQKSYSLFSVCTEEIIGSKQIAFAVGANILCSLLFAFSSLKFADDANVTWYSQVPWGYWGALGVLLVLCIYFFSSLKKK